MNEEHERRVIAAFGRQAPSWASADAEHRSSELFAWISQHLVLQPSDDVVDLCGGTGNLARVIAPHVRHVTVHDLTRAMLARGEALTRRAGMENISFVEGRADAMPFGEASQDLVVCKFGLHHVQELTPTFAEVFRILKPHGRFVVIDSVPPPGLPDGRLDEIERLRDPSHARFWTEASYEHAAATLFAVAAPRDYFEMRLPFEQWAKVAQPDAEHTRTLRGLFEAEAGGGRATGFQACMLDHELWLTIHCVCLTFARPRA